MTTMEGGTMTSTGYTLVIGDKNYSSWSLRPWLSLKACSVPFNEECVRLRLSKSKAEIFKHSPSGKVPALKTDFGVIYDSLAIVEYLAEQYPDAGLWPDDPVARAAARCVSAEMHAGFQALRNDMPMDLISRFPMPDVSEALANNIRRVVEVWIETRARFGHSGPLLFGTFTNADAMYTPVATRFRTYGIPLKEFGDDGTAAAYVDAVYTMPDMAAWLAGAEAEMRDRTLV